MRDEGVPFAGDSPPPQRSTRSARPPARSSKALPASASESALSRQPVRAKPPPPPPGPKPFLLRGTSGGSVAQAKGAGEGIEGMLEAESAKEGALKRSKTVSALEEKTTAGRTSAPSTAPIPPIAPPKLSAAKRRSLRPLSLAKSTLRPLSSTSSSTSSTLSFSRPRHTPIPSAPSSASRDRTSSAPPPSSTSLEAVEQRKLQMKRQTLLARQQRSNLSLSIFPASRELSVLADADGDTVETPITSTSSIGRSKRWFSRLTSAQEGGEADGENTPPPSSTASTPRGKPSSSSAIPFGGSSNARSREDRSLTPPFFASTSPGPQLSPVKKAVETEEELRSPVRASSRARQSRGGKGGRYGGLGVGRVRRDGEDELAEQGEEVHEGLKHESGYSSLQELLEQHGYRDTRVVTPQAKRWPSATSSHSRSPPAVSSLAPPAQPELKDKSSILSLRGLFSLWGSSFSPAPEQAAPHKPEPPAPAADEQDGSDSNGTLRRQSRLRTSSEMHQWVSSVAMASHPSPLLSGSTSTAPTPELNPSSSFRPAQAEGEFGSPVSGRSYSSSLSTSPPTPNSYRRPPRDVGGNSKNSSSLFPPASSASELQRSLRHAVSESALDASTVTDAASPHSTYQSFTGLGIILPPSFASLDEPPPPPSFPSSSLPGDQTHPQISLSPPAPHPHRYSSWLAAPTHFLRERTSQIFSLSSASAASAAVGRSASQRAQDRLAASAGGGGPKLLREAVSSAGLVAVPVLSQASVGTRSSAESLSLSIDSYVAHEEEEREMERLAGTGGREGGEDLLGRRW
ncbi:hypothetical protein JCM8547_000246 [Rhodosporidiobolus lusitaniae]